MLFYGNMPIHFQIKQHTHRIFINKLALHYFCHARSAALGLQQHKHPVVEEFSGWSEAVDEQQEF